MRIVVIAITCAALPGSLSAQEPPPVAQPSFVRPAIEPTPPPDAKEHLKVVATVTREAVTDITVMKGEGPPRGYLSQRSDMVVLLKGPAGRVLSTILLPDPLELRVMNRLPRSREREGTPATRHHLVHVKSTQLILFLPVVAGANVVEFHEKEESGKLLGSAKLPESQ